MSLDADLIADRRRMRRKLTFWRIVAFGLIILAIVGVATLGSRRFGLTGVSPYIARVTISGLIRDDRDRVDIRVGSRIYDMERSLIEATLEYFQGNKRRAADALGCSLKTLYNKLNGYAQRRANGFAQSRVKPQSQECASI